MNESSLFGISGRGWLAFIMIVTMCIMSIMGREIADPLRSAVLLTIGFYFGQKKGA
jgi:hypothetical protein